MNVSKFIQSINKALEPFFIKGEGGYFSFKPYKSPNVFRLEIREACSNALNYYDNKSERIKVVKWFSDFWLFVEIKFIKPESIFISLSVFQGEESNDSKNQLFRVEWDDYGEFKTHHPQPHWHFLNNKQIENTLNSFVEIAPQEVQDTFVEVVSNEKSKTIDLSKFHFALNGDWNNTSNHIHSLQKGNNLHQWFGGLLAYLKTELEYIDRKRG